MIELNLKLSNVNVDPLTSSLNINALFYQNKEDVVLIRTEGHLKLIELPSGKHAIKFPDDFKVYHIHVASLSDVIDSRDPDVVLWDSPLLKVKEGFLDNQPWGLIAKVQGDHINLSGNEVQGYKILSYILKASRSNLKPSYSTLGTSPAPILRESKLGGAIMEHVKQAMKNGKEV